MDGVPQRGDAMAGTLAHATPGDAAALLALLPSRQVATHPLHRERFAAAGAPVFVADATAAAAPVEKKKRAHKPRRPYRCGRCGLPKAGHICKFRSEQATTGTQTDFTSLQSPVNDLTLIVPRSHSSSDCSATSELSPNDKASGTLPTAVVSERSHSEDIADPTVPESSRPRRVRRPSMRRAASSATVEPADDSSVGSGSQRSRSRSPPPRL